MNIHTDSMVKKPAAAEQAAEGIPVDCQRCKHHWNYKGKNKWTAICPNCHTTVSLRKFIEAVKDKLS